jgi:hypothetical protein
MAFTNNHTKNLANKFLNFKNSKALKEDIEIMCPNGEQMNPYSFFSALVYYVIDELIFLNENVCKEEIELYNYLEEKRQSFSNFPEKTAEWEFDNALCISFLEGMLNSASHDNKIYDRFIPYLGAKCREFCKAWDQFTEVRSPGLWSDEEWNKAIKGIDSVG